LAAIQAQIQALLAEGARVAGREGAEEVANMEVAKPQLFDGTPSKVVGFVMGCKLYLRNKLAGAMVEEQVQWILSYVQGEMADVWKENIMEELENGKVEYESAEEFLKSLKKEFGGGEEESVKAAELRKLEQEGKTMEEFVQEFKKVARESGYKG